jgi:recombination protein RecA
MTLKVIPPGSKKALPAGESAAIIARLKKERGQSVLLTGAEVPMIKRIPTGIFEIDLALGGGIPEARISIIYGPEGSGKSNLCACLTASVQRRDPACNKVVWIDLEGTMDPSWMAQFGINMDELIVIKPSFGEEAGDILDALMRASDVGLVIVDSLAVLSASKESGSGGESGQTLEAFDVGTAAILTKRIVNKICWAFAAEHKRGHYPGVVFINQTRFKIGVIMGDPESMPGGNAVKFNSSLTLRLYGKGKVDPKLHPTLPVVRMTTGTVKKSKVPVRQVKFEYDMVVVPVEKGGVTLPVGSSDSWSLIKTRLQASEDIKPAKGGGYMLWGKFYKVLDEMRTAYYTDRAFQQKCQSTVLEGVKDVIMTVEASGAAATKSDYNGPEKVPGHPSWSVTKDSSVEGTDDTDPGDV